jgi:hypothetical protein
MVVMVTPVAFYNIKYQTYIIFAVINAFIFPVVYFFYPETAYRSLEEMDVIFQKCKSVFTVVKIADEEPRRYGKNGELLISYEEEHRRKSEAGPRGFDKGLARNVENSGRARGDGVGGMDSERGFMASGKGESSSENEKVIR